MVTLDISKGLAGFICTLIFVGIIFCICACCVGIKHIFRRKHRPMYHTAAYATASTYSSDVRPIGNQLSSPVPESSSLNQARFHQNIPTAPPQTPIPSPQFIPYPRYNPSVMQDMFREPTSSDSYARLQNQPHVHQWTPRPLSLQNVNQIPVSGPPFYPYQVQNSPQPFHMNPNPSAIGFI
ncbi:hypothetical protein ACKWTF_014188 [Chironomus riparius]